MSRFQQKKSRQPVKYCPEALAELSVKLAKEEVHEMEDALGTPDDMGIVKVDVVEMLDALCDQLYVTFGNAHRFGLSLILPVAFRRVHESNMTKLWTDAEIRDRELLKRYGAALWIPVDNLPIERRWLVTNSIGKAVKSPSYQPANLVDLLAELEGQELIDFEHANKIVYGEEPDIDCEEYEKG